MPAAFTFSGQRGSENGDVNVSDVRPFREMGASLHGHDVSKRPGILHKHTMRVHTARITVPFLVATIVAGIIVRRRGSGYSTVPACKTPEIYVGVFTAPGTDDIYASRRRAIRSAWFPDSSSATFLSCHQGMTIRFVVGSTSDSTKDLSWKKELRAHKDFLVLDVLDSYRNLAAKTIAFFTKVLDSGPYEYVLKIDDDLFLAPLRLSKAVAQWRHMGVGYIGCMKHRAIVVNNAS